MPHYLASVIVLAVLSLSGAAQAAGSASYSTAQPQADSPFGYERQLQKMMRPINDLLPASARDEGQKVRG